MSLVQVPELDVNVALNLAIDHALSHGITFIQDMGPGPFASREDYVNQVKLFQSKLDRNDLKLRIRTSLDLFEENAAVLTDAAVNKNDFVMKGTLKAFYDGSLGSKTALQFEPYLSDSSNTGLQTVDSAKFQAALKKAAEYKLQVSVHAIGEKAVFNVLNDFDEVYKIEKNSELRWRVEHAQQV